MNDSAGPSRNAMALVAFVLGIIGLMTSIVVVGALLGIVGIILGLLALRKPARRGFAITGIITGALSIPLAVGMAPLALALNDPGPADQSRDSYAPDCVGPGRI
jgi:hypothetical protein